MRRLGRSFTKDKGIGATTSVFYRTLTAGKTANASLVELADTVDLGSTAARFESSSLSGGTKNIWRQNKAVVYLIHNKKAIKIL